MQPPGGFADASRQEMARLLKASPLVRRWVWEETIDSTQRLARELGAAEGCGLLVVADAQTRGRGRMGHDWFSPRGMGLWMSIVLALRRPAQEWPLLTSLGALALRQTLACVSGLPSVIKWPNDLLCRWRKIAGVLAEVGPKGMVTLGVGLNVSQGEGDFGPDLRANATSILIETGRRFGRRRLLAAYIEALASWLSRFEAGGPEVIRPALREASVFMGRRICVAAPEPDGDARAVIGRVCDIGPLGELILEPENSTERRLLEGGRVAVSSGNVLWADPPIEEPIARPGSAGGSGADPGADPGGR